MEADVVWTERGNRDPSCREGIHPSAIGAQLGPAGTAERKQNRIGSDC